MSVAFVATGPGDAELLTLRAEARLAEAELVAYDAGVSADVLALAGPGTRLVLVDHDPDHVEQLVRLAREHERVVRLSGGDRWLLAAGGPEAEALTTAGIDVEVVPGVLGAFAAPARDGIPVMARDLAATLTVVVAGPDDVPGDPAVDGGTTVFLPPTVDARPVVVGAVTRQQLRVIPHG